MAQMLAYVDRPARSQCSEAFVIATIKSARRLLVIGEITRHRQHEAIDGFGRLPCSRCRTAAAQRLFNQSPHYRRSATGLLAKPIPMPREQCDLTRNNAKLRSTRAPYHRLRRALIQLQTRQHFIHGTAQINVERAAAVLIKQQQGSVRARTNRLFDYMHDIEQRTTCNQPVLIKCYDAELDGRMHNLYPDKISCRFYPD